MADCAITVSVVGAPALRRCVGFHTPSARLYWSSILAVAMKVLRPACAPAESPDFGESFYLATHGAAPPSERTTAHSRWAVVG